MSTCPRVCCFLNVGLATLSQHLDNRITLQPSSNNERLAPYRANEYQKTAKTKAGDNKLCD